MVEIRQLQDTRNELADTAHQQRKLNEAAMQADLDLKTKQLEKKLQVTDDMLCYDVDLPLANNTYAEVCCKRLNINIGQITPSEAQLLHMWINQ